MSLAGKIAPYAVIGLLIWAYLAERDSRIVATEELSSTIQTLQAEQEVAEARLSAADQQLDEERRLHRSTTSALATARETAERAREGSLDRDLTIQRLQLEVFNAEQIPDSSECLNVNVPSGLLYTGDCDGDSDSGDGDNPLCGDPSRANSGDPAFNRFTFGDALSICNANVDVIETLNGKLKAIRELDDANR